MRHFLALSASLIASAVLFSCAGSGGRIEAQGSFEATEVIVSAEASGRILEFDAEEGQTVVAGKKLGLIDALQLKLKREQLLASKSAVESRASDSDLQLAAIREQIETARRERSRSQKLIAANAANQKQLDDIDAQIATLEKQEAAQLTSIANANTGVRGDSASLAMQVAQLDDQIAKSSISSPIDGTVLVKYAQAGEYATLGKALFKVADLTSMVLRAYLDAGDLSKVKLGQGVEVLADYGDKGSRRYSGRISWISSQAEFTPKTAQTRDERANLVYAIKVAVPNDGYLKIGMYGKAELGK
jgi:HlyD family secretion protein